jgi:hypothetical protein
MPRIMRHVVWLAAINATFLLVILLLAIHYFVDRQQLRK